MRVLLFVSVSIAALALSSQAIAYYGGGGPEPDPVPVTTIKGKLYATVGPGFTITLKRKNGTVVKSIKKATWKIVVDDKSSVHNFHLTGPGSLNMSTTVNAITKVKWTVTLGVGTFTYICDPHSGTMKGTFKVIS
ncbi:MAG: hypothetical protein HYR49_09035 [Gammaproteobacteria bacterium]|nr:hypothetical protein [Gammaproteobacteria bacterium]